MFKSSVGLKIGAAFLLVILILGTVGILAYRNTTRLIETTKLRKHSYETREQLNRLLSVIKDAETGQRGYLLTGEERYLEPYNTAVGQIPAQLTAVRSSLSGSERQGERFTALQRDLTAKLEELDETIALRRGQGLDAALAVVKGDRGKQAMDGIRKTEAEMEDEENKVLEQHSRDVDDSAHATYNTITYGIAASALLMLLVELWITRRISRPLTEISEVAEKIASGDLSSDLRATERGDEVGVLRNAFSRMNGSLNTLAGRAQQLASGDLTTVVQPQSGNDVLGTAFGTMATNLRGIMREFPRR